MNIDFGNGATSPPSSSDGRHSEHERDAYGGRLRQGIPPFVIDAAMYSPKVVHMEPRPPGRPPKAHREQSPLSLDKPEHSSLAQSGIVAPVFRRGPGRPRIYPLGTSRPMKRPASGGDANPEAPKRGRGRPRIYPLGPDGKPIRPKYVYAKRIRSEPKLPREAIREVPRANILSPQDGTNEKRGPGRPRRDESLVVEVFPTVRRGRGRPAGSGRGNNHRSADDSDDGAAARRGRGRPPLKPRLHVPTEPPSLEPPTDRPTSPFTIRVERLSDEADRKAIVELFAEWFPKINRSLFRELVQPPPVQKRPGRRVHFTGPFHWLIRDVETNQVLCAASGRVHSYQFCESFMEISYFATRPSHLYLGLGRLLNAVLQKHAYYLHCEYILVQASHDAVFFWKKPVMGYADMPRDLMARFKHFYEMRTVQLADTVPLAWKVADPSRELRESIERLPLLVRLEHDKPNL